MRNGRGSEASCVGNYYRIEPKNLVSGYSCYEKGWHGWVGPMGGNGENHLYDFVAIFAIFMTICLNNRFKSSGEVF